ncbi:MAG: transcriptional regulator [Chitinophagaceae bacterium]|nr:MAG: transcriptional regulator [Chitinophagaceae bacterium]
MHHTNNIAAFVKFMRNKNNMTQPELANKAGVGLRFVRDLEQGKESLRLDKVNQVLAMFGYRVSAETSRSKNQWDVIMNQMNHQVKLELKDRTVLEGVILDYKMEEQRVRYWVFLPDSNAAKYRRTKDETLLVKVNSEDVLEIENT